MIVVGFGSSSHTQRERERDTERERYEILLFERFGFIFVRL